MLPLTRYRLSAVKAEVAQPSISRPNAERLTAMYRAVLEAMAADPEGDSLATHLPQEENDRMLAQWNDTAVEWS